MGGYLSALAALSVLAVLGAAAYWRRAGFRHRALARVRRLERRWRRDGDLLALLGGLSRLLRDTGVRVARQPSVAGLSGGAWLAWLDEAGATHGFSHGPGRVLRHGPYRPEADPEEVDVPALLALVRQWLRTVPRRVG